MTAINYSQYCAYRLPCGICRLTNSYCPLNSGTIDVTWTTESTSTSATVNPVAEKNDELAQALKIAINSVYGLTSAKKTHAAIAKNLTAMGASGQKGKKNETD